MKPMKIKIEDVFRPAKQTTPAGSMPAKEDNDAGRNTGRFLSLGSSHIRIRYSFRRFIPSEGLSAAP
jgi:hypothetical protein